MKNQNNILIAGSARGPENAAFYDGYRIITLVLEVDLQSGEIIDADVTFIAPLPTKFIREILIGRSLNEVNELKQELQSHFFTPTKKSLIQALGVCYKTYTMIKANPSGPLPYDSN